jgi:pimeloyl-ACP methyl ester carboxylesterase
MPYLALGSGPPLVYLPGFYTTHTNPNGLQRSFEMRFLKPFAEHFRVYFVNRAPHLAPDATMATIAAQHADAIYDRFVAPVDVFGVSSGGSVALQLAADHPDTVHRLVVAASGYQLSPPAREAQRNYARAIATGQRGAHFLAQLKVNSRMGRRVAAGLAWLVDPLLRPANPSDMLAFIRAEDAFDLGDRLSDIVAPTLVIAGDRDGVYQHQVVRDTAAHVRNGRLIVYPRASHSGTVAHRSLARDVIAFLTDS